MTEFLLSLRITCGAGTNQFDSERYLRERDAFGSLVMGWHSPHTIDIYDQSRDGERTLAVLGIYQQKLSERNYVSDSPQHFFDEKPTDLREKDVPSYETIWHHDAETLAWVKRLQQQSENFQ